MNMEAIMQFFYKRASERIRRKVESSGKTHAEIYAKDPKQISRIINNRRTRINPFLITDAIIDNYAKNDEESDYVKIGLLHNLGFDTVKQILWGSDDEIDEYLPHLFELLWNELPDNDSFYQVDKRWILCDYVPYAEYVTYWELLFAPSNRFTALEFGKKEDDIVNNIDLAEQEAFSYFYSKCEKGFKEAFHKFSSDTTSFHKIDKVFKEGFIDKIFVEMIKKNAPDEYSLGLRVRNLIINDLSLVPHLVYDFQRAGNIDEITKLLLNASSSYICRIKDIQKAMINTENINIAN